MKKIWSLAAILIILSAVVDVRAQSKKEKKEEAYHQAIGIIESGSYVFKGIRAYPQKGGQVDLTSRSNILKVDGERASADLPYFGRLTGGAGSYGSGGGGIEFDNEMIDYSVRKNDKKQRIEINFKARHNTESYSCSLTVHSVSSVTVVISSINRQAIRYSGSLVEEKPEE